MVQIPLSRGYRAIVDDQDADLVNTYSWHVSYSSGHLRYAHRATIVDGRPGSQGMHQLLLPGVPMIDHVNGDGLDNRRANLRPATPAQNMHNKRRKVTARSSFKGLYWCSRSQLWRARITVDRQRIHLGRFDDERAAALAYDEAARRYFGGYAALNFPRGPERSAIAY